MNTKWTLQTSNIYKASPHCSSSRNTFLPWVHPGFTTLGLRCFSSCLETLPSTLHLLILFPLLEEQECSIAFSSAYFLTTFLPHMSWVRPSKVPQHLRHISISLFPKLCPLQIFSHLFPGTLPKDGSKSTLYIKSYCIVGPWISVLSEWKNDD